MTIYDPKVEEAQIWMDLAEACPNLTLEQSMSSLLFSQWPEIDSA